MQIQAYLSFTGRCEEALAFYQQALGAEQQMLMRFKDSPQPTPAEVLPPGNEDKVMHASLALPGGGVLMLDDGGVCNFGPPGAPKGFSGFSLSINVADAAAAERVFTALGAGGTVSMPLGATFWSPCFGMLKDKFGVAWMVSVA